MSRSKSKYLPTLDGWRAVAISLVVFCHSSVGIGLEHFKEVGLLGVQIFFGLSGFLITTLLLERENSRGSISLRVFYIRRCFRILPAALSYLTAIGVLALLGIISISLARWASALFFMANYSQAPSSWYLAHFWSLAVEEHFYLVWPAVLLLSRKTRTRLCISIMTVTAVALWRAVDFKYHFTWSNPAWFWGRTDIQADGIGFGVIYALALADEQLSPLLKRILSSSLAAPLAIGAFIMTTLLPAYIDWKTGFALLTVRAAAVPAMILATLAMPTSKLGQILEWRPIRFLGVISYSLYLWQQLFLTWDPDQSLLPLQSFPSNLAAALTCAVLSFYIVETPMIRAGYRLMPDKAHEPTGDPSSRAKLA